jgi:hypothetical protein
VNILCHFLVLGILCGSSWGTPVAQSDKAVADPALQHFQRAIVEYLKLRARLANEIETLVPRSTAAQISAASDALARAIKRARPKPQPGTFFDAAAAGAINARLRELLARHPVLLDGIDDEVRAAHAPGVYARFPEASPVSTMPPSLLAVLPSLPPELEYRLVGEDLVLRDTDAALILDVLPKAVPRD